MIQFHIGLPTCTHRRLQATTSVIADLPACPNLPLHLSMLLELARQWLDAKNHPSSMHAAAQLLMLRRLPCHCAHPLTLLQYIYIYFNLRCKAKQSPVSQETWIPPEYSRPLGQSPSQESLKLATALKPCHNQRNSRYLIFRQKVWSEPNECFRINLPTAGTWLSLSYKYCSYSGWIE